MYIKYSRFFKDLFWRKNVKYFKQTYSAIQTIYLRINILVFLYVIDKSFYKLKIRFQIKKKKQSFLTPVKF